MAELDNLDNTFNTMLVSGIENVPLQFKPHIIPVYPPDNHKIFEEWVAEHYIGCDTDRVYLPIFFTSYWVNNNYGNDPVSVQQINEYVSTLDKSKKYWTIIQYDDGSMIDWAAHGLDVLEFNMSKTNGVMIPLLCQPHPYQFSGGKKWFANFIGGRTHPCRNGASDLSQHSDYYISFESHNIERYCEILHQSIFTLCYRGYGSNSFRIAEAVQYGSIPVYISDEFITPFGMDFNEFGVTISLENADRIDEILQSVPLESVIQKQDKLKKVYEKYYTYDGALKQILNELKSEYHLRK